MPVDLYDPSSIRPKALSVRREQHEVDVGIRASGPASMRTDQSDSPYFRLRRCPRQDNPEDKLNAPTVLHYRCLDFMVGGRSENAGPRKIVARAQQGLRATDQVESDLAFSQRKRGTLFQRSMWLPLLSASGTGSRSDVIANPTFSNAAI
jgi:hypothetical protein